MSKEQMIFKRYEVKFLMDAEQYQKLLPLLGEHMTPDEHGISLVQSLYYDTPDRRMIRRSISNLVSPGPLVPMPPARRDRDRP